MASPNAPKTTAELIRKHSKARVLTATPVNWPAAHYLRHREITRNDVVESLVRQYA